MVKNNKKKPSKRGMKAKDKSLHCSSTIKTKKSKINRLTKWVDDVSALLKSLHNLCSNLKPIISMCKILYDWF